MRFEKIILCEDCESAYLDAYLSDKRDGWKRKAILVIPGGGYSGVCSDREGEPIAQAFIPYGYQAFVLHYTTDKVHPFPTQLIEAAKGIKHIKDHADEYGLDADQLFVVGFSAGGHLAACTGAMWKLPEIYQQVSMPHGYNKPTGMILSYAVTSKAVHGHTRSFAKILGEDRSKESGDAVSPELQVSEKTCPAFIWHTRTDPGVLVQNALVFAKAMADHNRPFELHIYPEGPHGLSLNNDVVGRNYPAANQWTWDSVRWMKSIEAE